MSVCFDEKDMPGTYHDANWTSLKCQKRYTRIFRWMLIASVAAAGSTWLASALHKYRTAYNSAALVLAITAFVSTFVLKERKYEDGWYLGRAVAESVKTRTWRYMTGATPYGIDLEQRTVDERFIGDIRRILADSSNLTLERAPDQSREEISAAMRSIRSLSLRERLHTYRDRRIIDQRDWYGTRASANATSERNLFVLVLMCQFLASIVALYGILRDSVIGDSTAVLAAAGTGFVAWLQVKKYQETAKAYAVASHELSMAEALVGGVETETQLSKFVEDSESAISREHTLWIARRTS